MHGPTACLNHTRLQPSVKSRYPACNHQSGICADETRLTSIPWTLPFLGLLQLRLRVPFDSPSTYCALFVTDSVAKEIVSMRRGLLDVR
jgi:hypothetical protein